MRYPKDPQPKNALLVAFAVTTILLTTTVAPRAEADWLITLDGRMIETRGPWEIDGKTLTYTDLDGVEQNVAVDDIDLEGSEETTALRAGKTYEPKAKAEEETSTAAGRSSKKGKAKILLYVGGLCRTCTSARELLEELDVDFAVMNIDSDRKAAHQFRKKAGHGGGLPVIDVDGDLIFTFNPAVVRKKVKAFLDRQEADAEKNADSGDSRD